MAAPKYAIELKADVVSAQFNANGVEVSLTADSPRFETDDVLVYRELRQQPFAKDLGEVKGKGGGK